MHTNPHSRPPQPSPVNPLAEVIGALVLVVLGLLYAFTDVHAMDRLLAQLLAWL